eukprot:1156686-Pelagomonas_calceolata.AAC.3
MAHAGVPDFCHKPDFLYTAVIESTFLYLPCAVSFTKNGMDLGQAFTLPPFIKGQRLLLWLLRAVAPGVLQVPVALLMALAHSGPIHDTWCVANASGSTHDFLCVANASGLTQASWRVANGSGSPCGFCKQWLHSSLLACCKYQGLHSAFWCVANASGFTQASWRVASGSGSTHASWRAPLKPLGVLQIPGAPLKFLGVLQIPGAPLKPFGVLQIPGAPLMPLGLLQMAVAPLTPLGAPLVTLGCIVNTSGFTQASWRVANGSGSTCDSWLVARDRCGPRRRSLLLVCFRACSFSTKRSMCCLYPEQMSSGVPGSCRQTQKLIEVHALYPSICLKDAEVDVNFGGPGSPELQFLPPGYVPLAQAGPQCTSGVCSLSDLCLAQCACMRACECVHARALQCKGGSMQHSFNSQMVRGKEDL